MGSWENFRYCTPTHVNYTFPALVVLHGRALPFCDTFIALVLCTSFWQARSAAALSVFVFLLTSAASTLTAWVTLFILSFLGGILLIDIPARGMGMLRFEAALAILHSCSLLVVEGSRVLRSIFAYCQLRIYTTCSISRPRPSSILHICVLYLLRHKEGILDSVDRLPVDVAEC